jgi:hypothetical protein
MPQTISLVRGTTSVTGNSTSNVTLFTNSGTGIATRVIVNQLTFYIGASASGSGYLINLYHQSSGGYNSIVGQIANGGSGTIPRTEQWLIGGFPSSKVIGSTSQGNMPDSFVMGSTDTGGGGAQDVLYWPASTTRMQIGSNSSTGQYKHCPQTFWIGPSDVLRIKAGWNQAGGKGGTPATVNIGYSFTLITET